MLNDIRSIVNDYSNAPDASRAFTFIEFIKAWGFNNDSNTFITLYRDYLTAWAEKNSNNLEVTQSDFVRERMTNILRNITLTYSSYEEQDFISHIDWADRAQVKSLVPFYARKIKEICEFYRNKRNTVALTFNRNNYKGSSKSIEQIIYEKFVDHLYNNRNLSVQISDIQNSLSISVDNYIDTFSEYFDIPRQKSYYDERDFTSITANMNQVEAESYLRIEEVVANIIYSGDVHLEEIPLIAQLGLDLNQDCVGNMLILKNSLIANNTINLIPLTEQVALRRKLWQKYLGCDLYYMYVDGNGTIKMDLMCKAENPTGNLLNSQMSDTATTPADAYELLSNIGLFFKPDKNSILKVSAKDYTYEIDQSVIQKDTIYIFPDPSMYGDIGNNKSDEYPLLMIYHLDYDIKNISLGFANNDPAFLIGSPEWHTYFTKEDEILNNIKNYDFEYAFTSLANKGIISNYQVDIWGNQFGLFKGYQEEYYKETDKEYFIDADGNRAVKKVTLLTTGEPENYGIVKEEEIPDEIASKYILLNGGYFEDPRYPGKFDDYGKYIPGAPFNFDEQLDLSHSLSEDPDIIDNYTWSGIKIIKKPLVLPPSIFDSIDGMEFGSSNGIKYIDHYGYGDSKIETRVDKDDVVYEVLNGFLSNTLAEDKTEIISIEQEVVKTDRQKLEKTMGCLYIRDASSLSNKPLKLLNAFPWLKEKDKFISRDIWGSIESEKILDFIVMDSVLILDTENNIITIPYNYDENGFSSNIGLQVPIILPKNNREITKILYCEKEQQFYILQIDKLEIDTNLALIPIIYKFDAKTYNITEAFNPYDFSSLTKDTVPQGLLANINYINAKNKRVEEKIISNIEGLYNEVFKSEDTLLSRFVISYSYDFKLDNIAFSYNNSFDNFVISYSLTDASETPAIYECKIPRNFVDNNGLISYQRDKFNNESEYIDSLIDINVYTLLDCDGNPLKTECWTDVLKDCVQAYTQIITVFTLIGGKNDSNGKEYISYIDKHRKDIINRIIKVVFKDISEEDINNITEDNCSISAYDKDGINIVVTAFLPELSKYETASSSVNSLDSLGLKIVNKIYSTEKYSTTYDMVLDGYIADELKKDTMFTNILGTYKDGIEGSETDSILKSIIQII